MNTRRIEILTGIILIVLCWSNGFVNVLRAGTFPTLTLEQSEMDQKSRHIRMELVKTWGGEGEEDENWIFKIPNQIHIDEAGNIYILDVGLNSVRKFDPQGRFITQIGKFGEGPGEYLSPEFLTISSNGEIHILESFQKKELIYDRSGIFKKRFRRKTTIIRSFLDSDARVNLSMTYRKGLTFKLRKRLNSNQISPILDVNIRRNGGWDQPHLCVDHQKNLFILMQATPFIRKYDGKGSCLFDLSYELPYDITHKIVKKNKRNIILSISKSVMLLRGYSTDSKGNLYFVIRNKKLPKKLKEMYSLISAGNTTKKGMKTPPEFDFKDMFRLVVIDPQGKLIASKLLNVNCDGIALYKDHLYIMDTYYDTKFYKYKYRILK